MYSIDNLNDALTHWVTVIGGVAINAVTPPITDI